MLASWEVEPVSSIVVIEGDDFMVAYLEPWYPSAQLVAPGEIFYG